MVRCGSTHAWLPVSLTWFALAATAMPVFCSPGGAMQSPGCVVCVAELTVTMQLPLTASVWKLQLSVWLPGAPVTVHVGDPPLWPLQLAVGLAGPQLRLLLGSGSVSLSV